MLWIILYILALLACGHALSTLLADPRNPRRPAEAMGMSAAIGCGILPLILLLGSMLGIRPTRGIVLGIGVAAIATIGLLKWRNRSPRTTRPILPRMTQREVIILSLASGLIGFQLLCIFVAASGVPVIEVDAWNIWGLKAKVLYFEPLSPRPEYFGDLSLSYTHLDYPLLVPMLWAGGYAAMGAVDDAVGKAWLIVPVLGIIFLLYAALRDVLARSPAILLTALAIGSPALTRWGGQGLADTTLAVFILGTGVCTIRWIRDARMGNAIGAGLFAAMAMWTKLEGSVVIGSAAMIFLIATIRDRVRLRSAAGFLLTLVLIALPWWLWSRGLPHTHENYLSRLGASQFLGGLHRTPELLRLFWIQFYEWNWTIPAAVFVLAVGLNARAFRRGDALALWLMIVMQTGAYFIAYLVTPWELNQIIPITATRLVLHLAPLAMLLAGLHWREATASTSPPLPAPHRQAADVRHH